MATHCSQSGYVERFMPGSIQNRIPHRRTSLIKYHLTGMTCRISVSPTLSYIINTCVCESNPTKPHTQKTGTLESWLVIVSVKISIIRVFLTVLNNERNDVVTQTFFQSNQTPYSTIAVLERIDCLETVMKINNILESYNIFRFICRKKLRHNVSNSLRRYCLVATITLGRCLYSPTRNQGKR